MEITRRVADKLEAAIDAKVVKASRAGAKSVMAEVAEVSDDGTVWVHVFGSDERTPATSVLATASAGDVVTLSISGGRATLDGNLTSPAANSRDVNEFQQLVVTDIANIREAMVEKAVIDELVAGNAVIRNLVAETAKIEDLTAEQLTATVGYIGDLTTGNVTASSLIANVAKIADLTTSQLAAAVAYIGDLVAGNVTASNVIADHATVGDLDSNYAHITDGVIDNATIGHEDVNDLDANYAHISSGVIDNATISYADVNDLSSHYAHITNGVIDNATISYANVGDLSAHYAAIDAANITDLTSRNAWVDAVMVQTGLIAHESAVYTLDAIQVNAANITAGTIDVERLVVSVTEDGETHKYMVHIDPSTSQPTYEKLDGDVIEDLTITADKIVAGAVTAEKITTENIVGSGGWINLRNGTFNYVNATTGNGISWDGSHLWLKSDSLTASMEASVGDFSKFARHAYVRSLGGHGVSTGYTPSGYPYSITVELAFTKTATSGSASGETLFSKLEDVAHYSGQVVSGRRFPIVYEYASATTRKVTVDDKTYESTVAANPVTKDVLGLYEEDVVDVGITGDVFRIVITDANGTVRDMYPAKRLSDDAIGFYDLAQGEFHACYGMGPLSLGDKLDWISVYALESYVDANVNGLETRVAATYATNGTVNGIAGRVTTAETKIQQTANNVLIKATETDTTAAQGGAHLISSLINVATSGVTIDADKVNISGAVIFTSGRLSETNLDSTYDAYGAASAVQGNLTSYQNDMADIIAGLQDQVDGQIESWFESADPATTAYTANQTPTDAAASSWTTEALKDAHVGDLYYNVNTGHTWRWLKSGSTWSWTQIPDSDAAAALQKATDAETLAGTKRRCFTATPTPPYDKGDLWVTGSVVKYCTTAKASGASYAESDWATTATDDTKANSVESKANGANSRQQFIYISKDINTASVSANTTWVATATDSQNTWTTLRPTYDKDYPVLFVATQTQTVAQQAAGSTCSCTTPKRDLTTTVIDGANIITDTVSADKVHVTDLNAFGATIGGFAIDSTSVHTKDVAVTSNADNSIALASSDFTRTLGGVSRAGLRFAIGDKFGVTGDGTVYASGLEISPSQVTNLTNTLNGKASTGDVATAKSEAISTAASDATSKANAAQSAAISAAASDATSKANAAQSAAISAAASDATSKASAAQTAAISAAASDATTKANNAQSAAISTAATDATTKANNAAKTATNYISSTSAGIKIADSNPSTATTYQLQTATGTDFYVSGSKVASYGSSKVELAKNSTASSIEMCNGKGTIAYGTPTLYDSDNNGDCFVMSADKAKLKGGKHVGIAANWSSGNYGCAAYIKANTGVNQQGSAVSMMPNIILGVSKADDLTNGSGGSSWDDNWSFILMQDNSIELFSDSILLLGESYTVDNPGSFRSAIGVKPTSLYNNTTGTNGTVTLSASAANYDHMRIYYRESGSSIMSSTDIYSPNGKSVSVSVVCALSAYTGATFMRSKTVSISGTSITNVANTNATIYNDTDACESVSANFIYITRVEAWNE